MPDAARRSRVSAESVGQSSPDSPDSPDSPEERRQKRAGRGFGRWVGTAARVFSVVLLLLAIFLVVIFVAR